MKEKNYSNGSIEEFLSGREVRRGQKARSERCKPVGTLGWKEEK
jgi:hypothetical protein